MSSCPKCGQIIDDAFGIVQCPKCKLMLVADFDGNLKVSADGSNENLPDAPFAVPASSEIAVANDWGFDVVDPGPAIESNGTPDEAPNHQMPVEIVDAIEADVNTTGDLGLTLQDINNFANSEESRAREGILFYQIKISGIDSADLNTAVRDCLDDSKLNLNIVELVKSIRNGILTIPKLNAVKASVIVARLKEYPLEIEWSQMSLLNSEAKTDATT